HQRRLPAADPHDGRADRHAGNPQLPGGLSGSVGQFQFSAPIQPGASGGPVVDVRGNVLGVAVGTLNASELLKSGVLPQNVNFALESRYVEKFLQQHSVPFTEGSADAQAPGEVSIDEVLP